MSLSTDFLQIQHQVLQKPSGDAKEVLASFGHRCYFTLAFGTSSCASEYGCPACFAFPVLLFPFDPLFISLPLSVGSGPHHVRYGHLEGKVLNVVTWKLGAYMAT